VEGLVSPDGKDAVAVNVAILHNAKEIWPAQAVTDKPISHDMNVTVTQGDALYFVAGKKDAAGGRVHWDPVVTYTEAAK
jgi:hypothetical protein